MFRTSKNILRSDDHTLTKKRHLTLNIGYTIDVHECIGALSIQTIQTPGAMIFNASTEYSYSIGKKGRSNGIPFHTQIALSPIRKGE